MYLLDYTPPEAPLHILPLSSIFVGRLSIGIFLKAPIDMHEIAAPVSNNHLQDNPELVFNVINGLEVDWD
jgi:hypothetical protein